MLLAVLASTTLSAEARAFCRTTTEPVPPSYQPVDGQCWDKGFPIFWRNSCVGYNIHRPASRQVAYDDAANTLSTAFAKWTGASCSGATTDGSRVSIDVRDLGPAECGQILYSSSGDNQNVILFRDDAWPHSDPNNTLALTTVTFDPYTGEIYDADMEINTSPGKKVTVNDPVAPDGYDFASIVTHEVGHFLGLAHSQDSRATMFANYTPGNTVMRNLTADDIAGICAIYRPDGSRAVLNGKVTPGPSCNPTPRRGFSRECAEPEAPKQSCLTSSVAAQPAQGRGTLLALALVAAGALGRRVRRAPRRS